MSGYINAMRRYVEFSGRSSRSEFWFFVLFYIIIYIVAIVLDAFILGSGGQGVGILTGIVILAHLIPAIAVSVRRLHDIDRTGWWVLVFWLGPLVVFLISMIAMGGSIFAMMSGGEDAAAAGIAGMGLTLMIVGLIDLVIFIVAIVFYVTPGTPGPNTYGPPPF